MWPAKESAKGLIHGRGWAKMCLLIFFNDLLDRLFRLLFIFLVPYFSVSEFPYFCISV